MFHRSKVCFSFNLTLFLCHYSPFVSKSIEGLQKPMRTCFSLLLDAFFKSQKIPPGNCMKYFCDHQKPYCAVDIKNSFDFLLHRAKIKAFFGMPALHFFSFFKVHWHKPDNRCNRKKVLLGASSKNNLSLKLMFFPYLSVFHLYFFSLYLLLFLSLSPFLWPISQFHF